MSRPEKRSFTSYRMFLVISCLLMLLSACGADPTVNPSSSPLPTGRTNATPDQSQAPGSTLLPGTTTATDTNAANPNLIRIYSSVPLAGGTKQIAQTSDNVYKMALDDFTGGSGKIGNYTIEYVTQSDGIEGTGLGWDDDLEKANITRAINDPNAMVYLGPDFSGAVKGVLPLLNKAGLAIISSHASYPGLTQSVPEITRADEPDIYYPTGQRNFFRITSSDNVQGVALVELFKQLKAQKIFVIADAQAYGKGLASSVIATCLKQGLDCSRRTSISGTESNYTALVQGIKANSPDAIMYAGTFGEHTQKLLSDIRAAGLTMPFVGGDGLNFDTFAKNNVLDTNIYCMKGGVPNDKLSEKGQQVLARIQAKYGQRIDASILSSYETMSVALTAIKNAGTKDRKAVIQALATIKDFDGTLGKWSFNQNGDIDLNSFTALNAANGSWKYYLLINLQKI